MMQENEVLAKLALAESQILHLQEQVAWYKSFLTPEPSVNLSRVYNLTYSEAKLLQILINNPRVVSKEMAFNGVYHNYSPRDWPEALKILDVFMCKIRNKLRKHRFPVECIETVWGRGWLLVEPGRSILKELVDEDIVSFKGWKETKV